MAKGPFRNNDTARNEPGVCPMEKNDGIDKVITLLNDISEWEKVIRFTQTVVRVIRAKSAADDRRQARFAIIRTIQRKYYASQTARLKNGLTVVKSSIFPKLNSEFNENNILRVGGRLTEGSAAT